jgi:hypothetical protein
VSRFDDNLDALVADGAITEEQATALRDASPLRAERDAARAEADQAKARAVALEGKQAADIFGRLGIPGTPDTYKLPDGVDITDEAQISAWATENKIIAAPPASAEQTADQAAHQRMDAVTAGGGPPAPPNVGSKVEGLRKQILRAGPDQLQPGSELYSRVLDTLQEAGHTFGEVEHSTTFERIPEWGATK